MDGQEREELTSEEKSGIRADLISLKTLQFQIPAYALALDGALVWAKGMLKQPGDLHSAVVFVAGGATLALVLFACSIWGRYRVLYKKGTSDRRRSGAMVFLMGGMLLAVIVGGAIFTCWMVTSDEPPPHQFELIIRCPVPW